MGWVGAISIGMYTITVSWAGWELYLQVCTRSQCHRLGGSYIYRYVHDHSVMGWVGAISIGMYTITVSWAGWELYL